ncbi:hypothetical protein D3C73_1570390 [compost metagenome]
MAGLAKTAAGPFMAGGPNRVHQHQQRVVIAIGRNADHIEEVAGGFALGPQALFGAREKGHFAAFKRFVQCFKVHITQH